MEGIFWRPRLQRIKHIPIPWRQLTQLIKSLSTAIRSSSSQIPRFQACVKVQISTFQIHNFKLTARRAFYHSRGPVCLMREGSIGKTLSQARTVPYKRRSLVKHCRLLIIKTSLYSWLSHHQWQHQLSRRQVISLRFKISQSRIRQLSKISKSPRPPPVIHWHR
jgi:hypothetical protein